MTATQFLETLRFSSWIDVDGSDPTGVLLIAAGEQTSTSRLPALARTLRLARVGGSTAHNDGPDLTLSGGRAVLRVGFDTHVPVRVGPQWAASVNAGQPAVVALGAAPLPTGATRARTIRYLNKTAAAGLLYRGRPRIHTRARGGTS